MSMGGRNQIMALESGATALEVPLSLLQPQGGLATNPLQLDWSSYTNEIRAPLPAWPFVEGRSQWQSLNALCAAAESSRPPTFSLPPNPAVRVRFHENAHQASVILAASTTAARCAPMEIIGTVTFLDSGNLATVLHDLGLALGDTSAESNMPFSPFSTWAVEVLPSYDMARTRDDSATTARFVVAYTGPGRTDRTFVQFTLGAEDTKRLDGKLVGFIAQAEFLESLGFCFALMLLSAGICLELVCLRSVIDQRARLCPSAALHYQNDTPRVPSATVTPLRKPLRLVAPFQLSFTSSYSTPIPTYHFFHGDRATSVPLTPTMPRSAPSKYSAYSNDIELANMTTRPASMTRQQLIDALQNSKQETREMEASCKWSVLTIAFAGFLGVGFVGGMGLYAVDESTDRMSDMTGTQPSATVTVTVTFCPEEPRGPTTPSSRGRLQLGEPGENQDGGGLDCHAGVVSWKKPSAYHVEVDAATTSSKPTSVSTFTLDYITPTSTIPIRVQFTEDPRFGGTHEGT
ncbi:uncharacterized protein MKK02DRAFT_29611 [Dioszegia hungarica]|uniref:Transmembrane protein n=1 Tax=Dioszegia hungarica TaxID=4972 RepID=A0AA38HHX6_9TREE|nr:uncharacterized protein MKK02DRAFT_29611 [Dioszegia hungarica]KAI9639579.1 hypothetical protein MKK02DRAFT_29611 [Dioszegia hungarica]